MKGISQLASWILMSIGASGILLFVSLGRYKRSLPPGEGEKTLLGVNGAPKLGSRLLLSFALGLGAVFVVGFLFLLLRAFAAFRHPIFAVFIEESVKALALFLLLPAPMRRGINSLASSHVRTFAIGFGAINGLALGMGFGLGEAILYSLDSPGLLLLRGVSSIVLHSLSASLLGRWIATGVLGKTCWYCPLAALLLHASYNLIVGLDFPYNYFAFLLLAAFAMRVLSFFGWQENE